MRCKLMSYSEDISDYNILLNPTRIVWKIEITRYEWKITPKTLWSRIHKFGPNYYPFFGTKPKLN